jgi:hypothetical protein
MLLRNSTTSEARRGVILMVVLALLTLFAIVGLSFVLYAQAEADASRIFREDKTLRQVLESPDRMFSFALSKLIYDDYDDATGVYSALRGHSLARSMYGLDYYIDPTTNSLVPNQTAFNGTGRLAYPAPAGLVAPNPPPSIGFTDAALVNYTFYANDGFLRDPERLNSRAGLAPNPNAVTGGINVPYTYPDLNNMFLAAITAGGQVLMPSFHRPWLFGSNDPVANANWERTTAGKYLTLRPRPVEQLTQAQLVSVALPYPLPPLETLKPAQQATLHGLIAQLQANNQLFPYPEDAGGDVKNLWWLPGGNDSYWVDLGYPVQTAPDGRKYKPMFAFFITDLDNRINLNVHGNIQGLTNGGLPYIHRSNQGWGPWEVNLSKVLIPNMPSLNPLADPTEWQQIFTGVPTTGPGSFNQVTNRGRYGWDQKPNDPATYSTVNQAQPGTGPHLYAQVDFDGKQELAANYPPTQPVLLPGQTQGALTWNPYNSFGGFPAGYGNGNGQERSNHPLLYDFFKPFSDPAKPAIAPDNRPAIDDRIFSPLEMKELLNGGLVKDPNNPPAYGNAPPMAANAMKSQLGALLPYNFNDPLDIAGSLRRRGLVTTLSMDMSRPGMMPWMWDATKGLDSSGNSVSLRIAQRTPAPGGYDPIMSPPPWGWASPFPPPTNLRGSAIQVNSEFNIPGGNNPVIPFPNDPTNWRAAIAAVRQLIGRLDLSQALPPYPNQLINPKTGVQNVGILRFDDTAVCPNDPQGRTIVAVYAAAQQARVNLATDIYLTLRKLCGVPAVAMPNAPTDAELMPRRWLAQLAVNIVDFIDADNISTPFQFYSAITEPGTAVDPTKTDTGTATSPNELFRYWVFGTELPKIVLNEALGEYSVSGTTVTVNLWAELFNATPGVPPTGLPAGVDQLDGRATPIYIPATATSGAAYAAYRVAIANTNVQTDATGFPAGGPLVPREIGAATPPVYNNDNVLGTPDQIRGQTDDPPTGPAPATVAFNANAYSIVQNGKLVAPAAPAPLGMLPTNYLLIGPGSNAASPQKFTADAHGTIPANVANGTLAVPSNAMTYSPKEDAVSKKWTFGGIDVTNDRDPSIGVTLLLRRLANPHMPYNPVVGPTFNPFVTVDYMERIPLHNTDPLVASSKYYTSIGKLQPMAAHMSQYVNQGPKNNPTANPYTAHTFGSINDMPDPMNPTGVKALPPFDWLVHLDRQLVSPVELLYVSAFHPHELTHRFILPGPAKQGHLAPWFDQTSRLYRLWEFVETTNRAYGVTSLGRRPGKININTVWDPEILLALFDAPPSPASGNTNPTNYFWQDPPGTKNGVYDIYNSTNPAAQNSIFGRLMGNVAATPTPVLGRSPQYLANLATNPLNTIGPNDRPFLGMAAGNIPPNPTDPLAPNGMGINDTFLRVFDMTQVPPGTADPTTPGQGRPDLPRLFENPRAMIPQKGGGYAPDPVLGHPYLRFESLNKIYNNLTTRSNVFGVWCTVGYFEVLDDTVRPVRLGAEIGKAAGTNVRHRFFSVIDRTELVIAPNLISSAPGAGGVVVNTNNPLLGPGQAWVELDMQPNPLQPAIATFVSANPKANPPTPDTIIGQKPNPIPGKPPLLWTITGTLTPGAGTVLVVDRGTANEEWVQVLAAAGPANPPPGVPKPTAIQPVWIQANFIRPHTNPGFGITQPGNPGPQPPLDVRDYQHAPVIPVSVTIN